MAAHFWLLILKTGQLSGHAWSTEKQKFLVIFYIFNFDFETKALFCIEQVSMAHNNQCKTVKANWHCWESQLMKVKVVAGGRITCCSCCSTASCTILLMSLLISSFKHGSFSFLKSYPVDVQKACRPSFGSLSYSAVRTFLRHVIFSLSMGRNWFPFHPPTHKAPQNTHIHTQSTTKHTHTHTHISLSLYIYVCMYVCIYISITHIHTYIHTCIHAFIHTYIHAYRHTERERERRLIDILQRQMHIQVYLPSKGQWMRGKF